MRFMVMHKVDAVMEAGGPPEQRIIDEMGSLVGESLKAGVFLDGAGLHRSARRARVKQSGGKSTAVRGPYQGGNELVSNLAMIKTRGADEAIACAERLAAAIGDAEIEVGPVVEAWDLGMMPKPKSEYERFLLVIKGDAKTEAGNAASSAQRSAMKQLNEELTKEGVLLKTIALGPSSKGTRLAAGPKDKRTWVDGPFAESKELIAGFSLLELPTLADAIAWANRYAAILGDDSEVDIRELEA